MVDPENDGEVLRTVGPNELAALVEAYRQAQAAEITLRAVLGACGIPARVAQPVATVDDHGRPLVRVIVDPADRETVTATLSGVIGADQQWSTGAA